MSETIRQIINRLGVPKTTVATLADISKQELSLFFRDPSQLPTVKQERIESTVSELHYLLAEVFPRLQQQVPITPDLRDVEGLKKLLDYLRKLSEPKVNGQTVPVTQAVAVEGGE
jgi:hypothetical protein